MPAKIQKTCFWGAMAALLIPLLAFRYFPSVDGPAHVLNASLLDRLLFQHDAELGRWFVFNPVAVPNWSGHVILMALVPFMRGAVAERVLIGIYVVGFLLAFRFLLRSLTADTRGLEFLALPLVYNMHVYWGFYNFCLSLSLYLVLVGAFVRYNRAWTKTRLIVLAGLAFLLYFSHPLMFLFALLTVAVFILVPHRAHIVDGLRALWLPALAFLPSVLLYLDYALFRVKRAESLVEWPTPRYAASLLFTLSPIAPFGGPERYLAIIFAVLVFGLAGVRMWQLRAKWPAPELLCLALVGALSVFLVPVEASGGTMITPRLVYLPVFALIAWLAVASIPAAWGRVAMIAGITIAAALQMARIPIYRNYDRELTGLIDSLAPQAHSGELYAEESGDASGPLSNSGDRLRPDISPHAIAFLGVSNGVMILSNYEAEQDHFPLVFRPAMNPYIHILRYLTGPSRPPAASLSQVDAFLFWCGSGGKGNCATDKLEGSFELQKLAAAPPEARWFVRKTPLSARARANSAAAH